MPRHINQKAKLMQSQLTHPCSDCLDPNQPDCGNCNPEPEASSYSPQQRAQVNMQGKSELSAEEITLLVKVANRFQNEVAPANSRFMKRAALIVLGALIGIVTILSVVAVMVGSWTDAGKAIAISALSAVHVIIGLYIVNTEAKSVAGKIAMWTLFVITMVSLLVSSAFTLNMITLDTLSMIYLWFLVAFISAIMVAGIIGYLAGKDHLSRSFGVASISALVLGVLLLLPVMLPEYQAPIVLGRMLIASTLVTSSTIFIVPVAWRFHLTNATQDV